MVLKLDYKVESGKVLNNLLKMKSYNLYYNLRIVAAIKIDISS